MRKCIANHIDLPVVAQSCDGGTSQRLGAVHAIDLHRVIEALIKHVWTVRGEEYLALVWRLSLSQFTEDLDYFTDQLGMDPVFRLLQRNQRRNMIDRKSVV